MLAMCLFLLLANSSKSRAHDDDEYNSSSQSQATTPPRGWNSYDSYSWIISEEEFLQNAKLVAQKLLPFGYQYVVVDFLWYRKRERGASVTAVGFDTIDEWGRPIPDPARWPSSAGGQGFKPVADQVHAMGLKFGIHVMRGISTQAVRENTPILGTQNQTWRARDVALQNQRCSWMPQCFVSVNESTEGGKAFIQSLYDLYASWEVDYVKHDCVFGVNDLSVGEITTVSQAIVATGRPMLYSISPGVQANPSMATLTNGLVNMYRVTSDDWDSWNDLHSHFDVARDFAAVGLIGATGLLGFSWPDLDMLPIGYLTDPGANHGPKRFSRLTLDEQRTQVTLWAMAKSPLMFGGDMINLDNVTLDMLTNSIALEINANSFGNMEVQVSNVTQCFIPPVSLLDCNGAKETSWRLRYGTASRNTNQLCWTHAQLLRDGCLYWEPSTAVSESDAPKITPRRVVSDSIKLSGQASIHENRQSCLDAQASTPYGFSRCSQHRNQIWHVKPDGKLVSNATELCAVVNGLKFNTTSNEQRQSIDTRIWMARGPRGEYYAALFNLEELAVDISVPLDGIIGAGLPSTHEEKLTEKKEERETANIKSTSPSYQCRGKEVWSNQDIGTVRGSLPAKVASHGCALFSLDCNLI